jgi:formate/nitrite transporter
MDFWTPKEVCANSVQTWQTKANLSIDKMMALGILAGAYIAFGAEGSTMVTHDIAVVGVARLVSGAVFATGLIMVVIAGAELFTGNVLITIGALHGSVSVGKLLRNWFWVYVANFVGSLIVAYLMYLSGLWTVNNSLVGASVLKIAVGKTSLGFTAAVARGIFCNWLVCLAVWMAFAGKDVISKIFGIFFPIMLFVASNFEHSVANMYYIPAGIFAKNLPAVVAASKLGEQVDILTWRNFLVVNLLPVTIGNIIGAALFVACFYWFAYLRGVTGAPVAAAPAEKAAAASAGK